jgi:hypothetical protein
MVFQVFVAIIALTVVVVLFCTAATFASRFLEDK